MSSEKTIFLIDGSAYIYRAFHAIRHLSASSGLPTNAVYGFTRMLLKLFEDRLPRYGTICFDAKGPTFRHKLYPQYKANRPPMPEDMIVQLPYIREIVQAFNLPDLEKEGFEADDLIGTLARRAEKEGFEVVMVTGDKDFLQLVSEHAVIWDPMKDKLTTLDTLHETYGIEPRQMIDVMGLSGDTSDNIPGVPGIGPKTALKLIQTFGSMEALYRQVDTIKQKKLHENLVKYREQAFLSRRLVTIDTGVPVDFDTHRFRIGDPDRDRLSELFSRLEFRQLQQSFAQRRVREPKRYRAILDEATLADLVSTLKKADGFAVDTETTSTNPVQARLVGLSFAVKPHEAFYIPCDHDYPKAPPQLGLDLVLDRLRPVLEDQALKKTGQNIKYDWIVLERHGVDLAGVDFDTMVASYLLNPSKRAHGLDQIALDFLDHKTTPYKKLFAKGKKPGGFNAVPLDKAVPYSCEDADITLLARQVLAPKLRDLGLQDLFQQVEIPLIEVLKDMELCGIAVDREALEALSQAFSRELEELEQAIYRSAGEAFNINSPQQLSAILFEKLKLPVQKKTRKKTAYSTDVDVLTALADHHELPALILRHRSLSKLKSTYTDALVELINPETGRIHTSFNQTVTATGRLSSSDPNLQNIPVRTAEGRQIRRAFVPRQGWHLLSADYSQIELRILAHYSEDPILIRAFAEDEDIHLRTAAEVFQMVPDLITPELRRQAKIINFGIIYGMGAFRLSNELGISRKMAQTYIDNYFQRYAGVKRFIDEAIESVRRTGKTSTLLGRIRLLPEINSANRNVRLFAERTAINTPIQGTAADLIKVAMIRVHRELKSRRMKTVMLLSVHDEIVFEVPPDETQTATRLAREVMEGVWELKVPLKVNVALGSNWAEAH